MKLRTAKNELTYLTSEVIDNCYMAIYFQPQAKDELTKLIQQAVDLYNNVLEQLNHPAEKKNAKLVKKHYSLVREKMFSGVDELFGKISELCKK